MSTSEGIKKIKKLHSRNRHLASYNFEKLTAVYPALRQYIIPNKSGEASINFSDRSAVKALNKALLKTYYDIDYWEIPADNLCPPIPGRADYIHYAADLLGRAHDGVIPRGKDVKILDVGVGANCIYPIVGNYEYDWNFVGAELDLRSHKNASEIVRKNVRLRNKVDIRIQYNPNAIFTNIIKQGEKFDLTICNPPFFGSNKEVMEQTMRKLKNLGNKSDQKPIQNFGGSNSELWCNGGERVFITNMIRESVNFKHQVKWFSTLVSKKDNLRPLKIVLERVKAKDVEIINMEQGNKLTRLLVWRF
ncbi:23S rRNA (adenine(1618)-N(6))-methyltransferase RlmF [Faecalibacter rhinopitheci]|uniref:Ribosomal RNA large subunit methyltransferase F n=1 Tax=Faecalibacter rhinopitheci TaxID=2779678 RepID=A0A8J7FSR3_9FLAO|nr:23S rRNA (adenine(1618)-N(6))-methyltransferase RlmF [Faecalibacter rhinopitheci]MBF0598213.1 23S rRNA (adenine(1618)-N(6))-methyltransferase RlmF [Faecalibacter rhinopitheci]MBQ0147256.1 23S rRNA (adenine(1618)-N(6))-methyltransferase RlmF [Candidatus Onthonaster equi]